MKKSNAFEQWKAHKVVYLKEMHTRALMSLFIIRGWHGEGGGLHGTIEENEETFNSLFLRGLETPGYHPLFMSAEEVSSLAEEEEPGWESSIYGSMIALECFNIAVMLKKATDDSLFRQDTEDVLYILTKRLGNYFGYHWAVIERDEKSKKQKKDSGKGQKMAFEVRSNALIKKLEPHIEGDELKMDKGQFCKLLSGQFTGREAYPRDAKTLKRYREKIEEEKKIKLIWEKGTIIPD